MRKRQENTMLYKTHYESPLGDLLLTADAQALTGVWFDGQKYYAQGQADLEPEAGAAICNAPCEEEHALLLADVTSTCRSIQRELIFRKASGAFYARSLTARP